LSIGIFQKLRVLGRWQPMTNLPDRPASFVVSAMIAAITAPTKPTPITTTTSCPAARASSASLRSRCNSLP